MMKPWVHVIAVFIVATVAAAEPYRTTHERVAKASGERKATVQRVRARMDSVVFPKVSLSGVTVSEALAWVGQNISKYAPDSVPIDQRGISMVLSLREGAPELVNISLRSATLPQVLDAICAHHDYIWCLEPYALSVMSRKEADEREAANKRR